MAYWPGVLFSVDLLELSLILPFDIRELKSKRESIATSRVAGFTAPTIIPITIESLEVNAKALDIVTYKCIVSNNRTYEVVTDFMGRNGDGWLHISTSDRAEKGLQDISRDRFERYVTQRTAQLLKSGEVDDIFANSVHDLVSPKRPPWSRLLFPGYAHGITRPNELIAASLESDIHLEKALRVTASKIIYLQ
jgi:hypothetical protein